MAGRILEYRFIRDPRPTGIMAMDGRFEIVRSMGSTFGFPNSKPEWVIWDNYHDMSIGYPFYTKKNAVAQLTRRAEAVLREENIMDTRLSLHYHYGGWPDTEGVWYTPEECRAAGWTLAPSRLEGFQHVLSWFTNTGKEAGMEDHPKPLKKAVGIRE